MNTNKTDEPNQYVERGYDNRRQKILHYLKEWEVSIWLQQWLLAPFDFIVMIIRILADPKITDWTRLEILLAILYLIVPDDIIPDYFPGIGIVDDVLILLLAMYRLFLAVKKSDPKLFVKHWPGSSETLQKIQELSNFVGEWVTRIAVLRGIGAILRRIFS